MRVHTHAHIHQHISTFIEYSYASGLHELIGGVGGGGIAASEMQRIKLFGECTHVGVKVVVAIVRVRRLWLAPGT